MAFHRTQRIIDIDSILPAKIICRQNDRCRVYYGITICVENGLLQHLADIAAQRLKRTVEPFTAGHDNANLVVFQQELQFVTIGKAKVGSAIGGLQAGHR